MNVVKISGVTGLDVQDTKGKRVTCKLDVHFRKVTCYSGTSKMKITNVHTRTSSPECEKRSKVLFLRSVGVSKTHYSVTAERNITSYVCACKIYFVFQLFVNN